MSSNFICYYERNKMIPKGMPKKQTYFQSTFTTTNFWVRKIDLCTCVTAIKRSVHKQKELIGG